MADEIQTAAREADAGLFAEFAPVERDDWIAAIEASLGGRPWQDLTRTLDGVEIPAVATAEDIADIRQLHNLPGEAPYTRGVDAAGYRAAPWRITSEIATADPSEWNRDLQELLAGGQSAIFIGARPGLESVADLKNALADVDLSRIPLLLAEDERALRIGAQLREAKIADAKGCVAYDPLHGLAAKGFMPNDAFDRMAEHVRRMQSLSPQMGSIAVRADIYHDAGASAVQELAYILSTAVVHLRQMLKRGFGVDDIASGMHVFLTLGEDFFVEIARIRALRRLWSRMTQVMGAGDEAQKLKLHAATGRRNTSALDPQVNSLRAATGALAAVIGGVDSLRILPFDAPTGKTSAFSRRLALNMQHIAAQELGLTRLIDPAGGSWHIESLTHKIANAAWRAFQEIERSGGMLEALRSGRVKEQVEARAQERKSEAAWRDNRLIGVNAFPNLDDEALAAVDATPIDATFAPDDSIQIEPLRKMRLAHDWEALRLNAERYRQRNGHRPRVRLRGGDKAQKAAARDCLAAGGFACVDDADALLLRLPTALDCLALNQELQAQLNFDK